MADRSDYTQKARSLLTARRFGSLCTHSRRHPGYPFGSVVNYALDSEWHPVFLLSGLAEHTKNLLQDRRASFLVSAAEAEESAASASRLTLLGEVGLVPVAEEAAAKAAFLERHPEGLEYLEFGDFALYRMTVAEAYFVGGFGEMGWIHKLT